jgi:hypothetical protein
MTHILLPYMVLALYGVMRKIDPSYMRAAEGLGARPIGAFRHVFLPLSLPGIVNGCVLVFTMCLGFYITPILLGSVDGFDQDETKSKRHERSIVARSLLASECDAFETFEFADGLFDTRPRLVKCFWKKGRDVFRIGSIRDCRAYSALACGLAI